MRLTVSICLKDFPGGSGSKESACNAAGLGFIPESGRCPGEGNGYPLWYSYLANSMEIGVWLAIVYGSQRVRDDWVMNTSGIWILVLQVHLCELPRPLWTSLPLVVKNLPANAGDIRDINLILPGSGRSPGGAATHSNIVTWRIPWAEEPGRLQSIKSQRVRHDWSDSACAHYC